YTVTGGVNNLFGGAGVDTFVVEDAGILNSAASTLYLTKLNGGSGNDVYDIDKSAYDNNKIAVTDTSGKNTLILDDKLDVYFDVKLGKKGKFSIGKEVLFTNGLDSDNDGIYDLDSLETGVSVIGKNAKSITSVIVEELDKSTKFSFSVSELASDVAGWLSTNGYKSSADVLASGISEDINSLLGVYAGGGDYVGSAQCYKNPVYTANV
ncbi:hypothetical protein II906_07145, partial [bacterium]|nr:hypothetical protein [bacterium]